MKVELTRPDTVTLTVTLSTSDLEFLRENLFSMEITVPARVQEANNLSDADANKLAKMLSQLREAATIVA